MSLPLSLSFSVLWILVIIQGVILLGVVRIVYQRQQTGVATGPSGGNGESRIGEEAPHFRAIDLMIRPTLRAG